jgi:hypothetical protein
MARKIIQIESDNIIYPDGQFQAGLYALCDDSTLWSGTWKTGCINWMKVNAPDTMEENFNSSQQLKSEIAALVAKFDCTGSERYSSWRFDQIMDKLRQLSAV